MYSLMKSLVQEDLLLINYQPLSRFRSKHCFHEPYEAKMRNFQLSVCPANQLVPFDFKHHITPEILHFWEHLQETFLQKYLAPCSSLKKARNSSKGCDFYSMFSCRTQQGTREEPGHLDRSCLLFVYFQEFTTVLKEIQTKIEFYVPCPSKTWDYNCQMTTLLLLLKSLMQLWNHFAWTMNCNQLVEYLVLVRR